MEITLADELTGVTAVVCYTVLPEKDVLTRSVRIENRGNATCNLEKAASFCVDLHQDGFEIIHLHGSWANERHIQRIPQPAATMVFDSKRGASSHNENPFVALVRPETTEDYGDTYGFCLMYSGSFSAEISSEQYGSTRVQMGIHSFGFAWQLHPGEIFQSPEAIMVYSDNGLGEMSRRFHKIIRENVCRGKFRDTERPVLINNWEATYFNFNQDKILALAEKAKAISQYVFTQEGSADPIHPQSPARYLQNFARKYGVQGLPLTNSGTALPVSPSPTAQTSLVCQKSWDTQTKLSRYGCIPTPIRRASNGPVRFSGTQLSKRRNRHKTDTGHKKPTQYIHRKLQQATVGKSEKSLVQKGFIQ